MSDKPQSIVAGDREAAAVPVYCYMIHHVEDNVFVPLAGWDHAITINNAPTTFNGPDPISFAPAQCRHGQTNLKAEFAVQATEFTVWTEDDRLRRYFLTAAATKIAVYCLRLSNRRALEPSTIFEWERDVQIVASGLLGMISFSGNSITSTLTPQPHLANGNIARPSFQRSCNWMLYGPGCGLDKAAFAHTTTITAMEAADRWITIDTSPSASATYFRDGFFVHTTTGLKLPIALADLGGTAGRTRIKSNLWTPLIAIGDELTLYPGCRHIVSDCHTKFNNKANFGGFSNVPQRNPVLHGVL